MTKNLSSRYMYVLNAHVENYCMVNTAAMCCC